jgi:subfamily B ATP-binding cassette protein MsbA
MTDKKIKKLSRKDVSKMSTSEFVNVAKVPFLRLLSYVKPYRTRFGLGVLFGVLYGLFNAVMMFTMKFIFEVVLPGNNRPESIKMPIFGEIKIPEIQMNDSQSLMIIVSTVALIPLLIGIRGLLNYLNQYCMIWVGNRVLYDLRDKTFSKLMNHSLTFFHSNRTGELIQTVFNQTRMAQQAGTSLASSLVKHPMAILATVAFLVYTDAFFSFVALIVFPLCMLPVVIVSNKVRKAGGKEEEEAGMLMVVMQEAFAGIRVVKAHAREEFERERFNSASSKMLKFIMRWRKAMEIVGPLVETVASVGIAAGLVYAWATGMTAAEFLILYAALIALYPHAKALSRVQIHLQKCLIATTKVFDIMDREPDIRDAPDAVELQDCKGSIEVRGVSFSYHDKAPALHDIDLHFEAGKMYALVGPSGAGKTTLFSLLLRFYDPDRGSILVDGRDIREYTQRSLRDEIGFVTQDTFLFHDSIRRNILYGRLGASEAEVEEAARKASAHEFILEQPNGYDTVVGDKGAKLSGGQQQRISIARAFLRNSPILLLDEAMSALDSESEKEVQAAVQTLTRGKTVIAIAHRLSTILDADQIIVMDGGEVKEIGRHEELLRTSELYRRLYEIQFRPSKVEENAREMAGI